MGKTSKVRRKSIVAPPPVPDIIAAPRRGVAAGRPTSHSGATLWNNYKDDILKDEPGIATAKNLGRRVAEVARLIHRP